MHVWVRPVCGHFHCVLTDPNLYRAKLIWHQWNFVLKMRFLNTKWLFVCLPFPSICGQSTHTYLRVNLPGASCDTFMHNVEHSEMRLSGGESFETNSKSLLALTYIFIFFLSQKVCLIKI